MTHGQVRRDRGAIKPSWFDQDNGSIFPGMQFMRLAAGWRISNREAGVSGGASFDNHIFRRYQLDWSPEVTLDFWYRGKAVAARTAKAFMDLGQQDRLVSPGELESIAELFASIWPPASPGTYLVKAVRLAQLNGKTVVKVHWQHQKLNREYLSLLIDGQGDGKTIHEIHYSAPPEQFLPHVAAVIDSLQTIQWRMQAPPPMSSIA